MSLFPDSLSRAEFRAQEERDLDLQWEAQQAYEYHVNEACNAIRMTPLEHVTSEFITSVLCTLSSRVYEAGRVVRRLEPMSEVIEAAADEIGGMA